MKLQNQIVLFISTPVLCLLLGLLLIISHKGMPLAERPAELDQLETEDATSEEVQTEVLLLANTDSELLQTVQDVLDEMRIGWRRSDHLGEAMLSGIHTVLICQDDLPDLNGEQGVRLINWVAQGGRLGLMAVPDVDSWLSIVGHKLGIQDYNTEYIAYHAMKMEAGTLPVFDGLVMDEELEDYALPVVLEEDCRVWMTAEDAGDIPLLWTREIGAGRVIVCNHTLINGKDSRCHVIMTLCALESVLVYPIVNAGMIFIDDFPAPQPEGFDQRLQEQYGLSIQGFYRNHWWPDMKTLTKSYGLRYTGVLVETYNQNMHAPFVPDAEDNSLIRYYASELLQSGGEIGLHGYNHQPLCPNGWVYAGEDYKTWDSAEDMAGATSELLRYGKSFLPDTEFTSYVPPSNYLSPEGKQVLLDTVPTLRAISGLYLPETGVNALVQEFEECEDGSISVPRITSGFSMDCYLEMVAAGELSLHGVFSHFIHPDDVLDDERGALLGWKQLYGDFQATLDEITRCYPALRWCTATEAAAAVQRYNRLGVTRRWEGHTLVLELSSFYDEAWLCLWAEEPPTEVVGAEIYEAGGGSLWLRATEDCVELKWDGGV